MKHNFGILITLVLISYMTQTTDALFSAEEEARIRDFVESVLDCREIPGLVLSVVKGNESWSRGYGHADIQNNVHVTNNTKFVIGSLGKAFTMTLLGHVLQKNELKWNTKLSDIRGAKYEFPDENRTREATLVDLLSHRTGLSSVADYGFIGGYPPSTTKQTMVNRLKYVPTLRNLGESFIYNNMMYMTLGHVTEVLDGGESWEDMMTSQIFEPIGMMDSKILLEANEVYQEGFAKPYILKDELMQLGTSGIYKITPLEPAGSIISTGLDMAKWIRFNVHNATTDNGESIVDGDMFADAFQEHVALSMFASATYSIKTPKYPVDDVTTGYGYAWFTSSYRGFRKVWHSGGLFSFVSLVWLYPDDNMGIFASTNGPGLPSNAGTALNTLFYFISDLLLGYEPWLDSNTACSYPGPWFNKTSFDFPAPERYFRNDTAKYTGTYGSHLLPDVSIVDNVAYWENGGVNDKTIAPLRFILNRIKGDLHPAKEDDTFQFEMTDPWEYAIERKLSDNFTLSYPVQFSKSATGEVVGFNITFGINNVISFRKDLRFEFESSSSNRIHPIIVLVIFSLLTAF